MKIQQTIKYIGDQDKEFSQWVSTVIGGEKIMHCIQCGLCSATCPLSLYMDYTPRKLMHIAKEGFKKEVLGSLAIWLCSSCYACTVECPKQIKVTDVMYALKQRAIQEGFYPKGFSIPVLAREFFRMVRATGRISESWLVTIFMVKTNIFNLLSMSSLGLKLLRTGRFSISIESIKRRGELRAILKAVEQIECEDRKKEKQKGKKESVDTVQTAAGAGK